MQQVNVDGPVTRGNGNADKRSTIESAPLPSRTETSQLKFARAANRKVLASDHTRKASSSSTSASRSRAGPQATTLRSSLKPEELDARRSHKGANG